MHSTHNNMLIFVVKYVSNKNKLFKNLKVASLKETEKHDSQSEFDYGT